MGKREVEDQGLKVAHCAVGFLMCTTFFPEYYFHHRMKYIGKHHQLPCFPGSHLMKAWREGDKNPT